ncbi:hypothetical protein BpHYR1_046459 [Brachionus plicatilis]|uniref:Uncharacterized protein n=1 Tax=Brachionus plicatilis TaxID=10195 RepID=A0A3M7Q888_BRAPC|nr:hypothetical protein BpHYR1_046459 [Brachionus plicatilis]
MAIGLKQVLINYSISQIWKLEYLKTKNIFIKMISCDFLKIEDTILNLSYHHFDSLKRGRYPHEELKIIITNILLHANVFHIEGYSICKT